MISEVKVYEKINSVVEKFKYKNAKSVFFSTFIAGILCHIYFLVQNIPNGDTMIRFIDDRNLLAEGRWLFELAGSFTTPFALSWVNGLAAIFLAAVTAVLVADVLAIEGKASSALTGIMIVVYPSFTSFLSYIHRSGIFMIALLFSVLAVKVVKDFKNGFVFGSIVFMASLAIYQTFLPITLLLIVVVLATTIINKPQYKTKQLFIDIKNYALMLIIGFVLYYAVLLILLEVTNTGLSQYQGIDALSGGRVSEFNIFVSIKGMLTTLYISVAYLPFVFLKWPVLIIIGITIVAAGLYLFVSNKIYKDKVKTILLILLGISIPFALSPASLLHSIIWYHVLMRMAFFLFFIVALLFSELMIKKINQQKPVTILLVKLIPILAVAITIWNFFLIANINYLNASQRFEKDLALASEISMRLIETEGFEMEDSVTMVGSVYADGGVYNNQDLIGVDQFGGYGLMGHIGNSNISGNPVGFGNFTELYVGLRFNMTYALDSYYVEKAADMPAWPSDGCIKEVDGVYIIKLS